MTMTSSIPYLAARAAEPVIRINFNCGCGFQTGELEVAVKHSREKHHSMTILGTIQVMKVKKEPRNRPEY